MSTDDQARTEPAPSDAPLPAAETPVTPPGSTLGAEARAAKTSHVAERPAPVPPSQVAPSSPTAVTAEPATIAPDSEAVPAPGPALDVTGAEKEIFPTSVPPRTVGFGGHLLGVVFGLVLAPLAVLVAGLGQSRIVLAYTPPRTGWVDGLGTTLLVIGALLLIGVVLLGLWSAAVPITGGAVVTAIGLAYIVVPETAYNQTLRLFRTDANALTVVQLDTQAVSGVVLLLGVLLLCAGIAVSAARSAGRRRGLLIAAAQHGSHAA